MMGREKSILTAGLILLVILGGAVAGEASPYKRQLKKWTRSDSVYGGDTLNAKILMKATLVSDDMFEAQFLEYVRVFEVPEEKREEIRQLMDKKRDDSVLVFLSHYSEDRPFSDLTNKRGYWQVRLHAGEATFEPLRIEKVKRPTPLDRLFYPYLNTWSVGYYVWFPQEAVENPFPWTLTLLNPQGRSKLVWKK